MPIYEYLCEGCGRVSEVMQKVNDPPPRSCPECGARKIAKIVSRTAFQLKGGGWYADLYASTTKEAKARGGGPDAPAKGESTATSTVSAASDEPGPGGTAAKATKPAAKPAKASTRGSRS